MSKLPPPKLQNESYELVPIASLVPHSRNVNQGDYGAIEASIKANGFFGALVVQRSSRQILSGNHRFLVAQKLGYTELPVTWIDVDDDRALRIMLADNRTARLGCDNPVELARLLTELQIETSSLEGTGFDGDFLDDLLKDLARESTPVDAPDQPSAQEETRPGVIVLCENVVEQENFYNRLHEMGLEPRKTEVTEKSVTTLAKPKK